VSSSSNLNRDRGKRGREAEWERGGDLPFMAGGRLGFRGGKKGGRNGKEVKEMGSWGFISLNSSAGMEGEAKERRQARRSSRR
jgi:hypothetical protein